MATTVSIKNVIRLQNAWLVTGSIALTGNYATHGDTLNLSKSSLPISISSVPSFALVTESPAAGVSASGYSFNYAVGTTLANGALQVFQNAASGSPDAEFPAGAYSAGLLAAKVQFQAIIPAL